jgi:hypothetical protein
MVKKFPRNFSHIPGNTAYDLALLHRRPEIAELLKPSEESPIEIDEDTLKERRLRDHVNRSQRIPQKEREKSQRSRHQIQVLYQPKFPEIFSIKEEFFVPSFVEAVHSNSQVGFF